MSNKIGNKIRQLRLLSGLSQENVAYEIGMSNGNYGKIERGEIDVSSSHLIELARVLKVNVSDFFENKLKTIAKEQKLDTNYATKAELSDIALSLQRITNMVEKIQEQFPQKKIVHKKKTKK